MCAAQRRVLSWILVVDPGFFFSEIFGALEVRSGSQPAEAQRLELLDKLFDRRWNRWVGLAFNGQGFIHDLGSVTGGRSIDENGSVEISIAGIDAFQLMLFDQPFLFEQ